MLARDVDEIERVRPVVEELPLRIVGLVFVGGRGVDELEALGRRRRWRSRGAVLVISVALAESGPRTKLCSRFPPKRGTRLWPWAASGIGRPLSSRSVGIRSIDCTVSVTTAPAGIRPGAQRTRGTLVISPYTVLPMPVAAVLEEFLAVIGDEGNDRLVGETDLRDGL